MKRLITLLLQAVAKNAPTFAPRPVGLEISGFSEQSEEEEATPPATIKVQSEVPKEQSPSNVVGKPVEAQCFSIGENEEGKPPVNKPVEQPPSEIIEGTASIEWPSSQINVKTTLLKSSPPGDRAISPIAELVLFIPDLK